MRAVVEVGVQSLLQILLILGPGIFLAFAIGWVSKRMARAGLQLFPVRAYLFLFGWFGAVVHELSHAAVALLFGYKIEKVCLFQFDPERRRIGYIRMKHNSKSLYYRTGKLFVGTAPLVGCSAVIMIACRLLVPEIMPQITLISEPSILGLARGFQANGQFLLGAVSTDLFRRPALYVFLYVLFSVGNAMHMSRADLRGTGYGFGVLLVIFTFAAAMTIWWDFVWPEGLLRSVFAIYYLMMAVLVLQLIFLFPLLFLATLTGSARRA